MNFIISNALLIESMPLLRELCTLKNALINMQIHNKMLHIFSEDSDRYMKISLPINSDVNSEILGFDAHILVDIIKKTDRKEQWNVELKPSENMSIWKTSTAQIKLISSIIHEIAKYQLITLHELSLDIITLREGIKSVSFAISQSDTNPILNGILFKFFKDRLELVACDNFRLAVYKIFSQFDIEHEFVLPAKTINVLMFIIQQENVILSIKCYENKVHFYGTYASDGQIISWHMDSAVILGIFPRYEAIIGKLVESYALCSAYTLYKMIDQVSVISKDTSIVNLAFANQSVMVKSNSIMLGEYINTMPIESHLDAEYNVDFRTHLIVGLLKTFDKKNIRIHIAQHSKLVICTINDEQHFYAGIIPLQKH